ncbi:trans-feruloyl-CoA synthase [Sphaerotilus hippei]|uniref:Trans-feruloyl-CoA synthase n=1 Tax=Sphaerotilus hippei TaxID=744406 RepID=A0A318HDU9_9BURK|nr:feruloyl-CoA synthase [Sphaerotilus hippei]PXW97656.1 trans-feruloyl-CoA synthase [Sphaerotilus hippei]
MIEPRYRAARVGGCLEATLERRADGSTLLRSTEALAWHPQRLSDLLEQWAQDAPERTFVARRHQGGDWVRISYAAMLERARSVGQALLSHGLSVERPLAILSDNDLEHATLMMAAMWVGVPFVSVSSAYSLLSTDHGKLRHILGKVTPGMVYASDARFGVAIEAVVEPGVPVVLGEGTLAGRPSLDFAGLLATRPGPEVQQAHAATGPDTIVKFLFTSGSTRQPKGVITTHRMLCANQQMLRQCMAFLADEPPVLVDWLPWSHTFGGNHNLGIALYNGGTIYLDDGKPTPRGIAETLRNLREISPTLYFNVPKGFEEISAAMEHDEPLRQSMFRRVKAFMFAAAGLSQAVWDRLDAQGERTVGERIRMLTSLGMTETAPSCTFVVGTTARSGDIGLPCPGVEVKLVACGDKTEIRFRGPNVMPGYWREPALTAEAFDEEGFYCTGDAVRFIDPADHGAGLRFDGRIAEDFKLSTGTFVSVGPLRARIVAEGHPCVQDAVITGLNRDQLGAMVFPRLADCRQLAGLPAEAGPVEVLHHPAVRDFFQALCTRLHAQGTGSANRIERLHVLVEPPSIDHGEITDKNSINQRAVLSHRAALVEAMHADDQADPWLIRPHGGPRA